MMREVQRRASNPVDGIPTEDVALLAVVMLMWSSHVAVANCGDSLIVLFHGSWGESCIHAVSSLTSN